MPMILNKAEIERPRSFMNANCAQSAAGKKQDEYADAMRSANSVDNMFSFYKINLVFPYFEHPNMERRAELNRCLDMNIENKFIDKIIIPIEGMPYKVASKKVVLHNYKQLSKTPTYYDLFEIANKYSDSRTISIICNSDIVFDETVLQLNKIAWNSRLCLALTRYDVNGSEVKFRNRPDSQDSWLFNGKIPLRDEYKINIGHAGCDNRIGHELSLHYNVYNASHTIKSLHFHEVELRSHKAQNWGTIAPPYKHFHPCTIEKIYNANLNKRVMSFLINTRNQVTLSNSLKAISPQHYNAIDWRALQQEKGLQTAQLQNLLIEAVAEFQPDLLFMQIQNGNTIDKKFVEKVVDINSSIEIVNFTGDVRNPFPLWFEQLSQVKNVTTIFTNYEDAKRVRDHGGRAYNTHMGFEESHYDYTREIKAVEPDYAFVGSMYKRESFDLADDRRRVAEFLYKKYKGKFVVFGRGWHGKPFVHGFANNEKEMSLYKNSKIIIGMNNVVRSDYTSARLQRTLASGGFYAAMFDKRLSSSFIDNEHLVYWKSGSDLISVIEEYSSNEGERKRIAMNGAVHVWRNYTWQSFVNKMLNKIGMT